MKKQVYPLLLVIAAAAILAPAVARAIQAPDNFKLEAKDRSDDKFDIELGWKNQSSGYNSIKIFRDSDFRRPITPSNFPPTSQSYLDTNDSQGFGQGERHAYTLQVTGAGAPAEVNNSVTLPVDSNIVTVKTQGGPAGAPAQSM